MAGTVEGGRKAAVTNKLEYGADFFTIIGGKGGFVSRGGGFASNKIGPDGLTGKERASIAGTLGGQTSRRTKDAYAPKTVPSRFRVLSSIKGFFTGE